MGGNSRQVDQCPFRRALGAETDYCCDLVAQISGVSDLSLCRVQRDACEACCRSFPPSRDDPNPVIASLLYQLGERLRESGDPSCGNSSRPDQLIQLALQSLPFEAEYRSADEAIQPRACRLEDLIPSPPQCCGPAIRSWAVGVTTAPRSAPTLSRCLASLVNAGWQQPRLFVDGAVEVPEEFAHLPQTRRDPQVGAWPNYYLALAELLMREPEADAYLLVQDDALFCDDPGMKRYLERTFWPGPRAGIASLFCSRADIQPQAGWSAYRGVWRWCALAFVFSRASAQRFLADLDVVQHRWSRRRNPLAHITWCVGRWAATANVPVYFPTPSLIQHIGEVSTLWTRARTWGNRRASWFAGHPPDTG